MKRLLLGIVLLGLWSCKTIYTFHSTNSFTVIIKKNKKVVREERKSWQHKDITIDTIPGISLDKAYADLLNTRKGDTIIVAVLDSGFDSNHEDLKPQIWTNTKEIPNNNIDDDKNGYVDDVHGWNFLGAPDGTSLIYGNYEVVRILQQGKTLFEGRISKEITPEQQADFEIYQKAKIDYNNRVKELEDDKQYLKTFLEAKEALKKYFPKEDYTREQLATIDTVGNKKLQEQIALRDHALYWGMDDDWIKYFTKDIEVLEKYSLNFEYNGRKKIVGDNPYTFDRKPYGNNNFAGDLSFETHGTNVAGVIAATRNNGKGLDGITNTVKIMPIRVIPRGDEYDKDVAMAIHYATNNGAKVINMSFGKQFSPNKEFVHKAIQYAAKHDVLLVTSAGNSSLNTDTHIFYPNDFKENPDEELTKNFISVGASSIPLNQRIFTYFTNYGKKNVDLFAPGEQIYTTKSNNEYEFADGTSIAAPIVSGIAALIRSYYPDLTAPQVKQILMQSGVSYNIEIGITQEDGTKKMVPFSELSKSGKIVNAYNALLMAERISKSKN
ncbi:S8 family peptidase [Aquimarina celericrescens]|uniref:S8 family peptidase n=1 Tax=Aquimarina celericrescens TaxID=1964542 RepID=A0ABW5AW69_9FLAO|nr:S8 family peptidase [Aquimarina celericrescens]